MADNYSEATVNTNIPSNLVSDVEKELLQALGYKCEPADSEGSYLYFFQRECNYSLHIEDPSLFLQQVNTTFPDKDNRPTWPTRLIEYLSEAVNSEEGNTDIEIDFSDLETEIAAEDLFQGILNKPANSGSEMIDEIIIMGAYYCSVMRPEQFGGWVTRITRDNINTEDTFSMLERLRCSQSEITNHAEGLYSMASTLFRLHDLLSKIVEEDRVNWVSDTEHNSVIATLQTSKNVLGQTTVTQ